MTGPEDDLDLDFPAGLMESIEERRNYHLLAAWRAGHRFVDEVEPEREPLAHEPWKVDMMTYVHHDDPDRVPERQAVRYDLGSVPDGEIREAARDFLKQ